MVARLTAEERAGLADLLPQWRLVEGREAIIRRFTFEDFRNAFAFMTEVAKLAEAQDHHPEWTNVYNKVEIVLCTHDAGGLSMRDVTLAQAIDRLAS